MPIFPAEPGSPTSPTSALRLPAQKRISTPASQRLTTITEGPYLTNGGATPIRRPENVARHSFSTLMDSRRSSRRGSSSKSSQRTAPPPYEWVPEPMDELGGNGRTPVEGEKVARLRRGEDQKRGGWRRVILIAALALLAIIALAVGLGVGLTRNHHKNNTAPATPTASDLPSQDFPLGQYSLATLLETSQTNCTSNAATWRCYPYTTYTPSDPITANTSETTFDVIIRNTSSTYATNATDAATSSASAVPANLTISSTNPFTVTFTNESLTYHPPSTTNATSAKLTFSFTMVKSVVPSVSLAADDASTECFFNSTVFTGTLYLAAPSNYPNSSDLASATDSWPYAVEISQTAAGGTDVPNCYETMDGVVGSRVTSGLTSLAASDECDCVYRNY